MVKINPYLSFKSFGELAEQKWRITLNTSAHYLYVYIYRKIIIVIELVIAVKICKRKDKIPRTDEISRNFVENDNAQLNLWKIYIFFVEKLWIVSPPLVCYESVSRNLQVIRQIRRRRRKSKTPVLQSICTTLFTIKIKKTRYFIEIIKYYGDWHTSYNIHNFKGF